MRHTLQGSFLHSPSQFSKSGPPKELLMCRATFIQQITSVDFFFFFLKKQSRACETPLWPHACSQLFEQWTVCCFIKQFHWIIYSPGDLVKLQKLLSGLSCSRSVGMFGSEASRFEIKISTLICQKVKTLTLKCTSEFFPLLSFLWPKQLHTRGKKGLQALPFRFIKTMGICLRKTQTDKMIYETFKV